MFSVHQTLAATAAAIIPPLLFSMFAIYRVGPEIIPHPGLWIQGIMWAGFVVAGYFIARSLSRRP
jgi:hypothetical protein